MTHIDQGKIGDFPDLEYAKAICKMGHGRDCCRYLALHPSGFSCEKHGTLRKHIDYRVTAGTMVANSDNCEGKDAR